MAKRGERSVFKTYMSIVKSADRRFKKQNENALDKILYLEDLLGNRGESEERIEHT